MGNIKYDVVADGKKATGEAKGLLRGDHVILRANDEGATVEQLNGHESFHDAVRKNSHGFKRLRMEIARIIPKDVMDAVVKQYLRYYDGVYVNADMPTLMHEEIFADIAGRMSPLANIPGVQEAIERFNNETYGRKAALKLRRGIEKTLDIVWKSREQQGNLLFFIPGKRKDILAYREIESR